MTPAALKTLTWATIAAAVLSAALLAVLDSGFPEADSSGAARAIWALPTTGNVAAVRHDAAPSTQREPSAAQAAAGR